MAPKRRPARLLLDTSAIVYLLHGHTLQQAAVRETIAAGAVQVPVFVCMGREVAGTFLMVGLTDTRPRPTIFCWGGKQRRGSRQPDLLPLFEGDRGKGMVPDPTALALILCEQVIVDQHSRNPSPINIFTGREVDQFPSDPQRFSVFAALTDSQGQGRLELRAIRLDTGDQFYSQGYPIQFPDRTMVVNVNIRIRNLRFPVPGVYEFLLLVDGSLVAQRRLRVYASTSAG
jgi:hypothetical protein